MATLTATKHNNSEGGGPSHKQRQFNHFSWEEDCDLTLGDERFSKNAVSIFWGSEGPKVSNDLFERGEFNMDPQHLTIGPSQTVTDLHCLLERRFGHQGCL